MHRLAIFVATCAFVGYVPFAPGTFGSMPGLALAIALKQSAPWWGEWAAILVLTGLGLWAATAAERHFGRIDPGPVVIDEVVGMLITVVSLPLGWVGLFVGFLVFRACDIVKPFPAAQFERLPGGLGIMADDIMAAVWAHAIVRVLVWGFPGWML